VACGPVELRGGANFNEQAPGNSDRGGTDLSGQGDPWESEGGWEGEGEGEGEAEGSGRPPGVRRVRFREIAVDPKGRYVLTAVDERLALGNLESGAVRIVSGIEAPGRVAFAHREARFYVGSTRSVCDRTGTEETAEPCLAGERCDDGECLAPEAEAG